MRLGPDFSHDFCLKRYFLAREKTDAKQNRFSDTLPSELHVITRNLHVFTCNNIYVEYSD